MTTHAATAHDATPTPDANDALAGLRSESLSFARQLISEAYSGAIAVMCDLTVLKTLVATIAAQTERVAVLTAYKNTHHYSDEYVDYLHAELSKNTIVLGEIMLNKPSTDATAPTRETPDVPPTLWVGGSEHAERVVRQKAIVALSKAASDPIQLQSAVDEFNLRLNENPYDVDLRDMTIADILENPQGWLSDFAEVPTPPAPGALAAATKLTPTRLRALEHVARCEKTGKLLLGSKGTELRALRDLEEKGIVKFITEASEPYRMGWTTTEAGRALADATPDGGVA